jgi:hypothetical protein
VPYSPSFFAARASKPLESFSVNCLCSFAIVRARRSSAGGMASDGAGAEIRDLLLAFELAA